LVRKVIISAEPFVLKDKDEAIYKLLLIEGGKK
jgi:hypothetical protein